MSSSTFMEHALHPSAMETQIQKKRQADAKEFLCVGRFYKTNAGFHKELDLSKDEYTKSPLRSFEALPPLGPLVSERELLRVSMDTTFKHEKPNGGKTRGKKRYNYRRPCYLVEYDKSKNEGVVFLGTSKESENPHRFAIVHSKSPTKPLKPGSLGTVPPFSFTQEETYLNFYHPLRVRFAYFVNEQIEVGEIPYDGHKPPFVGIANYTTQKPDKGPREFIFGLDQVSEGLFWKKHKEYHMNRPSQLVSKDGSGGDGPDGGGSSSGGTGPSSGGAGPGSGGAGPSSGGTGPGSGGAGPSSEGAGPGSGGVRFSGVGFSSCKAEDAPWGRVGDQRIGIDIPLVTEDIYSDSDEEMDSEEPVINLDANDAPWGRVGDQRIGIDIPLVTEDIYSDSDEEMDLESNEELQEVGNVANVDKPESSD